MRLVLVVVALCLVGCGSLAPRSAPSGRQRANWTSYVSTDGEHFRVGPKRGPRGLSPLSWRGIAFQHGHLILSGLAGRGSRVPCPRAVLVQVGPPGGRSRSVVAWGESAHPACGTGQRRIELSPRGWTRDTIAASYAVHVPNPRASGQREDAAIPGSAVLQTDRRTIVIDYTFGGCSELTSAIAKQEGSRVTVRAVTGVAKQPDDTVCPMSLEYGTALIRLPREVPAGTTITVASA